MSDQESAIPAGGGGARVFVSYRRNDTPDATDRLTDSLREHFGKGQIFRDVDSIEIGADFAEVIGDSVAGCDVVLAVIGAHWLARDEGGGLRIKDPDDYVRLELEAGLQRNVRVVPVLIHDAQVPEQADLPESLHPLLRRNAVTLSRKYWHLDVEELIAAVDRIARANTGREAANVEHAKRERGEAQQAVESGRERTEPVVRQRRPRELSPRWLTLGVLVALAIAAVAVALLIGSGNGRGPTGSGAGSTAGSTASTGLSSGTEVASVKTATSKTGAAPAAPAAPAAKATATAGSPAATTSTTTATAGSAQATSTHSASTSAASSGQTSQATTTASATKSLGPLEVVGAYWHDIDAHEFAPAYGYLLPGSIDLSEARFVSEHEAEKIKRAKFGGRLASRSSSNAVVEISRRRPLETDDGENGCRIWSGEYELVYRGRWLIEKANIHHRPCGSGR
jgi:cytoskeletal protein RodZ